MGERKRILLVEDNANDLELAMAAFRENGVGNDVVTVRDGTEALDYLHRRGVHAERAAGQPCVIVLDIKMPKLGGLEVLRAIRADEQLKILPVVMLSSSREQADLARSYRLGVNAYVVKPVDFGQFSTAVRQLGLFWGEVNEPPPPAAGPER
jgi:CheY-like chemotaxis protein